RSSRPDPRSTAEVPSEVSLTHDTSVMELDSQAASKLIGRTACRDANRHPFTKLSILMAVYNEEATLQPCLNAILRARLPRGLQREVILVDDGSTDLSWKIAQQISQEDPRVRIFQQP